MPNQSHKPADACCETDEPVACMQPVFIIGAPRSGTTWLQLLLSQHPTIATCNETHLFSSFFSSALGSWESLKQSERDIGLHTIFTEAEFHGEIQRLTGQVFGRILAQRKTARIVLEKTPAHVNCWRDIHRILPHSRFIHLVRDPRSVVASLMRAGRGRGSRWADPGVVANSRRWLRDVSSGLAAVAQLGERCCRVSYEELRQNPSQIARLFEWIGLTGEASEADEFVNRCNLATLKKGEAGTDAALWNLQSEPEGFFGGGLQVARTRHCHAHSVSRSNGLLLV